MTPSLRLYNLVDFDIRSRDCSPYQFANLMTCSDARTPVAQLVRTPLCLCSHSLMKKLTVNIFYFAIFNLSSLELATANLSYFTLLMTFSYVWLTHHYSILILCHSWPYLFFDPTTYTWSNQHIFNIYTVHFLTSSVLNLSLYTLRMISPSIFTLCISSAFDSIICHWEPWLSSPN